MPKSAGQNPFQRHASARRDSVYYIVLSPTSLGVVALLCKSECGTVSPEEELRLRLLTPAIKALLPVECPAMEECMGALGGGTWRVAIDRYAPRTHPITKLSSHNRLIRDSMVKIWEGMINIFALGLFLTTRAICVFFDVHAQHLGCSSSNLQLASLVLGQLEYVALPYMYRRASDLVSFDS
jgi:hypothetical protein